MSEDEGLRSLFDGISPFPHVESVGFQVKDLCERLEKAEHERDAYLENLTATQARCTELLEEMRRYKLALQSIAGCNYGKGHMPELAQKALGETT